MLYDDVTAALQMSELPAVFRTHWDEALRAGSTELEQMLSPASIMATCETLRMKPELGVQCGRCAAWISNTPEAMEFFRVCCHIMYQTSLSVRGSVGLWPMPAGGLCDEAYLFYAVLILVGAPALFETNRKRGIDDSLTIDTLDDLELWIEGYHARSTSPDACMFMWIAMGIPYP